MGKKSVLQKINEQKISYLFIALPATLFFIFQLAPVFVSFFWSFTQYDVVHPAKFIGLANYKNILFHDPLFWKAIRNTVVYVIGVVPIGICFSLILAVSIDQKIKFKNFFKSIFFLPTVTAIIAVSVIWKWLYAGEKYGLINFFIMKIGFQPIDWLASPTWLLPSIMIMSIWAGVGYNMIIFLVGLREIPTQYYEAAKVDGAGKWQAFIFITLPLLVPITLYLTVMNTIEAFRIFTPVYVMTTGAQGAPASAVRVLVMDIYQNAFRYFNLGYASAESLVLFLIILFSLL